MSYIFCKKKQREVPSQEEIHAVMQNVQPSDRLRRWSTRDIEAAFTDENGVCLLSRSGVSEVSEALWAEYEAFQQRDLSDLSVLYVFLDGLYEPLRMHGIQREAVLCAWAITTEGDKVLSLALGNKESYDAWLSFLRDLVSRGLPVPLTITSDGAPGLLRANRRGLAQELAHPLLGTSHAQLQTEGARSSLARG